MATPVISHNEQLKEQIRPRLERIMRQHKAGRTLAEIARIEGVSRQRAHQLLKLARERNIA